MRVVFCSVFALWLLGTGSLNALEISSIAPSRGAPGSLVAIGGGPFSPDAQIFLGEQPVAPLRALNNLLEFTVPYLAPGNYILTVRDHDALAGQTYVFEVLSLTPQVFDIVPDNLDICPSEPDAPLEIIGRNFLPGAVLLINEKAVPATVISSTRLETRLRRFQDTGIYGVSVLNPDGAKSLPHSLWIDSIPEIIHVERGAESVNYYELVIHGKNFTPNSTLVVKEEEDIVIGQAYRQLSFNAQRGDSSQGGDRIAPKMDRLVYVDCRTLIYYRYVSSFQPKDLGLQIFNPDGRATDLYHARLP